MKYSPRTFENIFLFAFFADLSSTTYV